MNASSALKSARAAGGELALDGDNRALKAASAPPAAVLGALSRHKTEVDTSVSVKERDAWERNQALDKLMLDLVYAGETGWATAEFNLAKAGLIEMIQGHEPGLMREGDNGWADLRWTLSDLGRRTRKARLERVMKADPPLWVAEQDADEEAQDYQQTFAHDPDSYWAATHRYMSNNLDKRAERIYQKSARRALGDPQR
jgi:hypothetical protein